MHWAQGQTNFSVFQWSFLSLHLTTCVFYFNRPILLFIFISWIAPCFLTKISRTESFKSSFGKLQIDALPLAWFTSVCDTYSLLFAQGITLLMMGSVGELPQAPAQKTVFVEDMTEAQLASAVSGSQTVIDSLNIKSPCCLSAV